MSQPAVTTLAPLPFDPVYEDGEQTRAAVR